MSFDPETIYPLRTVYCTDEALAKFCPSDLDILTPPTSTLASGVDGEFGTEDPWTLTSATTDFEAQGVQAGMLAKLTGGAARGSGAAFVVGEVAGTSLTLRRIGFGARVGQPPSPPTGATNVGFAVTTLSPQIEQASDEINRRFGVRPESLYNTPTAIHDVRELELATMLTVLIKAYGVSMRTRDGDFAIKYKQLLDERSEVLARVQLRWSPADSSSPVSSVFGMRIVRG